MRMQPRELTLRPAVVRIVVALTLMTAAWAAPKEAVHTGTAKAVFRTLYIFTGGSDGYLPYSGLVFGADGNLYGTNRFGGTVNEFCRVGCGTVFQLTAKGGNWTLNTLYSFAGGSHVGLPYAHVTFDEKGRLYGTAGFQAGCSVCGGVFRLTPSSGGWKESVIFTFSPPIGMNPVAGLTLFKGDLYGSTRFGPATKNGYGNGTVFLLQPGHAGKWEHRLIHKFGSDGYAPQADLAIDSQGNVYESVPYGGTDGVGAVLEWTRNPKGGWTEQLLYSFPKYNDAGATLFPGSLTLDSFGNLYGMTGRGGKTGPGCGDDGCGTVFELKHGKTRWQEITLYEFGGGSDGLSPFGGVVFDSQGNLYGTTGLGGTGTCQYFQYAGCGTIFKLVPAKDAPWRKTTLYNFTGGNDGQFPGFGSLIFDSAGNLYGTTEGGVTFGGSGYGTVFEITP